MFMSDSEEVFAKIKKCNIEYPYEFQFHNNRIKMINIKQFYCYVSRF
jgi:hypothetical protein